MSQTIAAESRCQRTTAEIPPGATLSAGTFAASFAGAVGLLSPKPLHRPSRSFPLRRISAADLRRIAKDNPPPAEWFEGEDASPFEKPGA
jgi:hypothetical protein